MSDTRHLQDVQRSGRPLVLLDRSVPDLDVDTVVTDDRAAAAGATRVLIEAGHRRIAYISATSSEDPTYRGPHQIHLSSVKDRIEGVLEAAARAGIEDAAQYIRLGATRRGAARQIITDLLSLARRPTAILASDSIVALEVFRTIGALGLSIPADLSLIAFHDADWTSVTSPPITVIAQPVYDLGMESAQRLVDRIGGATGAPERVVLATTLIARQSVGAPAEAIPRIARRPAAE
jgi:LacI family transcriptional regulator